MITAVTKGIKISVQTTYNEEYSAVRKGKFVYVYQITIENTTDYTVQLLRRHWIITDANGIVREVEGEGIVGEQPYIGPHESYTYASWTDMMTDVGKMSGRYFMVRQLDGELFYADVPEFLLVVPFKSN